MNIKLLTCICLIVLFQNSGAAQKNIAIKSLASFYIFNSDIRPEIQPFENNTNSFLSYRSFSFGVSKYTSKRLHDFEFSQIKWDKETNDKRTIKSFDLSLIYTYSFLLKKLSAKKKKFYIGLSFRPYFKNVTLVPNTTAISVYNSDGQAYGVMVNLNPKIEYLLFEKLEFELGLNLSIADAFWIKSFVDNPNYEPFQRNSTSKSIKFFPNEYFLKIGFGYFLY